MLRHDLGDLAIRALLPKDERFLAAFGKGLGGKSRELFSPYPWHDERAATRAFKAAIARSQDGADAAYLVFQNGIPVAHCVLWGISTPHAAGDHRLRIPTLGLAVVDERHSVGIGRACVDFLKRVASDANCEAVELTTSRANTIAARLYASCGFEELGSLRIPLGVDPSTPLSLCTNVRTWRTERHMAHFLISEVAPAARAYLIAKQQPTRALAGRGLRVPPYESPAL